MHRVALKIRRPRDDRGATLVETAFVLPVFLFLVFGLFELSGYVMARSSMNASVQAGARLAVVAGDDNMADQRILERMEHEGAGIEAGTDDIVKVKIWHAHFTWEDPPLDSSCFKFGGPLPAVDPSDPDSRACNLYLDPNRPGYNSDAAFQRANLPAFDPDTDTPPIDATFANWWFGCNPEDGVNYTDHKYDCGWPPTTRRNLTGPPNCTPEEDPPASDDPCRPTDLIGIYIEVRHHLYTGLFGSEVTMHSKVISSIEPQKFDR